MPWPVRRYTRSATLSRLIFNVTVPPGSKGLKGKLKIISYDTTATGIELIKSGDIAVSITQEPFVQGAKPLDILLDYAGMNIKPEKEYYYTALGIVIKENL